MADTQRHRWGILSVAVVMFLFHLIGGTTSSPYAVFWLYAAYLAYKGEIGLISIYLKILIFLNFIVLGMVLLLVDANSDIWRWTGWQSKEVLSVLVGIPLAIKAALYLYIKSQIDKTKSNDSARNKSSTPDDSEANLQFAKSYPSTGSAQRASVARNWSMEDAYESYGKETPLTQSDGAFTHPAKVYSMEDAYGAAMVSQASTTPVPRLIVAKEKPAMDIEPDEDSVYEIALDEYEGPKRKRGLWAKLCADLNGDEEKIRSQYLKLRAIQIRDEIIADSRSKAVQKEEDMKQQKNLKSALECIRSKQYELWARKGHTYLVLSNGQGAIKFQEQFKIYESHQAVKEVIDELAKTGVCSDKQMVAEFSEKDL